MKFRIDFVTNSSSSSYIVLGKRISMEDLSESLVENEEVYLLAEGGLCDGDDYFKITPEILNAIFQESDNLKYSVRYGQFIIQRAALDVEDCNVSLAKFVELAGDCDLNEIQIFSFDLDYHCTSDLETFDSRYIN
jgi:hypothetical protein